MKRIYAMLFLAACLLLIPVGTASAQFPLRFFSGSRQSNSENESLRRRGFEHYQKGEYQQAIDIATKIAEADPQDPVSFSLRASAKIELGWANRSGKEIRAGIEDARRGIAIRGSDDAYVGLFLPYLYGMSLLGTLEGKPAFAETAVKTVGPLLERPRVSRADRASLLFQRAFAHEQAHKAAEATFDQSRATPDALRAFSGQQQQRRNAAIKDYGLVIQFDPKNIGAHVNRAAALAAAGERDRALAAYNNAEEVFPNSPLIYNDRGIYYRQLKRPQRAIADFTRAIEIQRDYYMAYVNRGVCWTDLSDHKAAEADFTTALEQNPNFPTVYRLRGTSRLSLGNISGSIEDFSHLIEVNSQDANAYADRGFAHFFGKNMTRAAADFEAALRLAPQAVALEPWHFLARTRAGGFETAKTRLGEFLKTEGASAGWVADICRFLNGELDEEDLLAAATTRDEQVTKARRCEAQFMIGQKKLISGDRERAEKHFQLAAGFAAGDLSARQGARYELGELPRN